VPTATVEPADRVALDKVEFPMATFPVYAVAEAPPKAATPMPMLVVNAAMPLPALAPMIVFEEARGEESSATRPRTVFDPPDVRARPAP